MFAFLLGMLCLIVATSAQFNWGGLAPYTPVTPLPQGSIDGWVYNGKGGLGRYQRRAERRMQRGYYMNGEYNYNQPLVFTQFYGR